MKPLIYDLDLQQLDSLLRDWGEPAYRKIQIWQGLYQKYWNQPDLFTSLPYQLRKKLGDHYSFSNLNPSNYVQSSDGETQKTLFTLPDQHSIEAVFMRYRKRCTICISTQAGCAMGCVFCATGQMGFRRNLSSGEIVEQVVYYMRQLSTQDEKITNVVLMGMGEPLHNYAATMAAIDRLNHPDGAKLGARRFTISTVGLVPLIRQFADEERQVNLAVSLHAVDDSLRSSLLPVNKRYPLEELFSACQYYVMKTRRRITFEWALIDGVNDSVDQARILSEMLKPFFMDNAVLCHVNLIPLNPTLLYSGNAAKENQARLFQGVLASNNIPCTIRLRRGIDIQAGCGQLAIKKT